MVTVQKQNVFLEIEDDNVDKYLSNGFSVVDSQGNIIKGATPTTVKDYQILNEKLVKELEASKQELAKVKQELADANKKIAEMSVATYTKPTIQAESKDIKPATTRRKTKSTAKAE